MTPTELQALLDREGVPMEARAAITLRKSGEYEDGAPAWFSDIGTEVPDDLGELAHVGAMLKWLIGEGYHSIEFDTDDNSMVSLDLIAERFSIYPTAGVEATTVLLAMACGRIAKEKDNA